jgi:hypothetical protein
LYNLDDIVLEERYCIIQVRKRTRVLHLCFWKKSVTFYTNEVQLGLFLLHHRFLLLLLPGQFLLLLL